VGPPVCALQAAVRHLDSDATVDDRDEVAEGGEVQGRARPRPIDAGEDYVAIEHGEPSLLLNDAALDRLDLRMVGRGGMPEAARERLDLRAGELNVARCGVEQPVEVMQLD